MAKRSIELEVKSIIKDFDFLIDNDSSDEILSSIHKVIELCEKESDLKNLRKKIIDILEEYVKERIKNGDFNLFLTLWDKLPNNGKIPKFLNRLKRLRLSTTPEFYMELLSKIPSLSVECEKIILSTKKKKELVNNTEMITLLQVYCALNDIEIDSEIDDEESQLVYSESDDLDKEFIKRIKEVPLLEIEEEYRLLKLAHNGDMEAKRRLTEANLRLVLCRVKNKGNPGITTMDLMQEGTLGLIKAIEKYDLEKKCKLSTYAIPWIDSYWKKALSEKSTIIRKSKYDQEKIKKFSKAHEELSAKLYKEATFEETATYLKLSKKQTELMRRLLQEVETLEKPAFDESEETFGDYIEDQNLITPEETAIDINLHEELNQELDKLKEKEKSVIYLRFGLIDGRRYTLKQAGKLMNISYERVRQLEKSAMEKLKQPRMREILDTYYR